MAELVKIGSFWKVENRKENSPILTGSLDNARLVVFPNKHKGEGANRPDYILYVQNKEKKEQSQQQPPQDDTDSLPF